MTNPAALSILQTAVTAVAIFNSMAFGGDLTVRCLAFEPGFARELHAHDAGGNTTAGLVEVKTYLNHENTVLKPHGDQLVFTGSMRPATATDVNEVVGQLPTPANLDTAILVFLPENADMKAPKCQVVAVDDSDKSFPAGTYKIVNACEFAVKIDLDGDSTEIAAGQSEVIPKTKFDASQAATMVAYAKKGEEWETISRGAWASPGDKRVLQLIYKKPGSNRIVLTGVRDITSR